METATALSVCHSALKHPDPVVQAAGESVLSALVVTLRHERVVLPAELEEHYKLIEGAVNGTPY